MALVEFPRHREAPAVRHGVSIHHVITDLGVGGAETALCRLIESLPSPAHRHAAIALDGQGAHGALGGRVRAAGASLFDLGMRPGRPDPRALVRLHRILRRARPDVAHGWMYHANLALALSWAGTPLVWGIRQTVYDLADEKRLTRTVIRAGASLSFMPRAITYNSTLSARQHEALGYRPEKTRIIPNGIDTAGFRPMGQMRPATRAEFGIAEQDFVIGHIARWHPMKDHENFLRAAAGFAQSHPKAVFMLVGQGMDPNNSDVSRLANELGIGARLRTCGRRFDIPRLISAMDAVASSSRWGEAFPNVVAEAMACGVPCAATDVGDTRDIVGACGIVVPPQNPAALSEGFNTLADMDETARRRLGERARARILERYSLAFCAAAHERLYREIGQR